MKKVCWFAFLIILSVSCLDDPDCYQLHNDIIGVTFRVIGTGQADSTYLKNFPEMATNSRVTYINYKLNYFEEQAAFLFEREKENKHLSIGYTVKNQFVSEDCGSRFVLSDLTILNHDFDSARVVNATPAEAAGGAHVDLYRCPETDTLGISFNQLYATSNGITVTNKSSKAVSHEYSKVTSDFSGEVFSGRVATLYLPVDLKKQSTRYDFSSTGASDSLRVTYETRTETRYRACGQQTFVNALKDVSHSFDSISYGLTSLDEAQYATLDPHVVNFRVYDCPKTNLMQVNFVTAAAVPKAVLIKSIKGEHFEGNLPTSAVAVSSLTLPVDTEANESIFYIEFEDRTDTLRAQYSLSPVVLYKACGTQRIVQDLVVDPPAVVATNGSALKFPTVSNVQITVN